MPKKNSVEANVRTNQPKKFKLIYIYKVKQQMHILLHTP
jgi:hypothetical protein